MNDDLVRRRMRRRWLIALVGVGLVVVGSGAFAWRSSSSPTVVSATDAVRLAGGKRATQKAIDPGLRPKLGVYSYTGHGWDSFSLAGGKARNFPKTVSAVVGFDQRDCNWTMYVVFIKEHVERRSFCSDSNAVRDEGFDRTTIFLGREQTSTYECRGEAMRLALAKGATTWKYTCTEDRGGTVRYSAELLTDASLQVGDETVTAKHLVVKGVQRGEHVGDERSEYWLLPSGLPVRFASTRVLVVKTTLGHLTSREEYDYTLSTLEPDRVSA